MSYLCLTEAALTALLFIRLMIYSSFTIFAKWLLANIFTTRCHSLMGVICRKRFLKISEPSVDGVKGPLLVYTNHINNEKHVHHGFLTPQAYLCSTSLNSTLNIYPGCLQQQQVSSALKACRF